jgi:hypothetical protein
MNVDNNLFFDALREVPLKTISEEIRQIRTERHCSLLEAKRIWELEKLKIEIGQAKTQIELKRVLLKIVDRML